MLSSQAIILLGQTIDIEELKVTAFSRNKNGMKNRLLSWVETLFCCNFGINEFLFKLRGRIMKLDGLCLDKIVTNRVSKFNLLTIGS